MGQNIFNCGLGLLGAAVLLLLIFAIRRLKYDASKMAAKDGDELEVTIPGQENTVQLKKAPKPVKVERHGIDYEDDEEYDDADPEEEDIPMTGDAVKTDGEDAAADEQPEADAPDAEMTEPADVPDGTAGPSVEAEAADEAPAEAEALEEPQPEEAPAQEPADDETDGGEAAARQSCEAADVADNSGADDPDQKEGVVSE